MNTDVIRPEIPIQIITPDDVRESIRETRTHLQQAASRIAWQVEMETWVTLGYKSWDEMREAEYGDIAVMVPRKDRPELVERLRDAGLTHESIASTVGVNKKTIQRDLSGGQMSTSKTKPGTGPPTDEERKLLANSEAIVEDNIRSAQESFIHVVDLLVEGQYTQAEILLFVTKNFRQMTASPEWSGDGEVARGATAIFRDRVFTPVIDYVMALD